jgi:NitT/TauT family transport system ATP-binding protein
MAAISISGLTVRFGDVLAVDNLSVDIEEGEFVSIVGPSGCGKTTVLNLLTGLVPLAEGRIALRGKAPALGNPDVAYMLARDSLLPWRSALANASYGMEIRGVAETARHERARELLARVGLAGFEEHYPKMLSHGMRQRCALARTFCLDSPVMLMDEPFGALDAQTKLQLEDLLLQLWTEHRRTVVFITHDLAEAVALSDRVLVMSARPGRIVADMRIPLSRPRSVRELQKDRHFLDIYAEVWTRLEEGLAAGAAFAAPGETPA